MHARDGAYSDDSGWRRARRASTDDRTASLFADFFDHQFVAVVTFLVVAGFDRDAAADAAQDAMVDAFRTWSSIDNPAAWIRTAALRRARKRAVFARKEALRLVEKGYGAEADDGTEPYREVEGHEELSRALDQLPDRQRQVIALHYEELEADEIADALGMRPGTVRSTLCQARKKLKKLLASGKETCG